VEYDTRLDDLALDLTDEEIEESILIDLPAGATVVDWRGLVDGGDEDGGGLERGARCPDCKEEWISQIDLIGALECQHGPENDRSPACRRAGRNYICKELDPLNGNCECFKCQGIPFRDPFSITCEEQIRVWEAWCGVTDEHLNTHRCRTKAGLRGAVYETRRAQTTDQFVCNGANGSFITQLRCGKPDGVERNALACRATNCRAVGAWGGTVIGNRRACR
jgi:hypothetical protein